MLSKEQYIIRNDTVSAQLHSTICKEMGVKLDNEHWYVCFWRDGPPSGPGPPHSRGF